MLHLPLPKVRQLPDVHTFSFEALGTCIQVCLCKLSKKKAHAIYMRISAEAHRIDATFSRFNPKSELSFLNARVGDCVAISPELAFLIRKGQHLHKSTHGFFSLFVAGALSRLGYPGAHADSITTHGHIRFRKNNICISAPIDVGGIGKGYFLDRVATLTDHPHLLVSAGGDIYTRGSKADGSFRIALEDPRGTTHSLGIITATGRPRFFCGSAANRRVLAGGHHLIEPHTQTSAHSVILWRIYSAPHKRHSRRRLGYCTVCSRAKSATPSSKACLV